MAILVNGKGKVVEVAETDIEILLATGCREATEEEIRIFNRGLKRKVSKKIRIYFRENNKNPHGYGQSTDPLINSLEDAGIEVTHDYNSEEIGMIYSYPDKVQGLQTEKKIIYTMFESTSIDPNWVQYLNMADLVVVPSHFCKKAFATRGVKTEVVPLGYNPENFYYREKEDDGVFTFLMYNAFDLRKGWDILFNAFVEEFEGQEDVRLIFKSVARQLPFPILKGQYPNIDIILESVSQDNLRELLYKADCFVFPSRGEGFGLTPLEALACGTTSIIPDASGMSEYFDSRYFIELKTKGEIDPIYENFDINVVGKMVEPSKVDLKKKMRWAYNNRITCWNMGKEGSEWVRENYSVRKTGLRLSAKILKLSSKNLKKKEYQINNPRNQRSKASIAFFLKNRDMYSGGRIFCYQILQALADLDYNVTIYTNLNPFWEGELKWNRGYKTVIIPIEDIMNLEVEADIYMGAVQEGNMACAKNSIRTGRQGYCFTFDPIPMIELYDSDRLGLEKNGYYEIDEMIRSTDKLKTIFLTKFAQEVCKDYYKKESDFLYPCVNEIEARKHKSKRRNKWIVATGMTGERDKGFELALETFSKTKGWKFHIFTSSLNSRLEEWIDKYELRDSVVAHYDEPDKIKYNYFARARVLLSPSPYEGYGMWLAEARYMGLECVIQDGGALREVAGNDKHIRIAERGNKKQLLKLLKEAMKVTKFVTRRKGFEFSDLKDKLSKILE